MEEMRAASITTDSWTFNILVKVYVGLKDEAGAHSVIEDMKASNIEPDQVSMA